MSALEHAIPERFFNDPTKCNAEGTTTPVLGLPVCPQGISAVKAIGLAASQGQKIYTITQTVYQNNPNIVNTNLAAHTQSTRQAVQNALDIGHEVTIHEAPITQSGWTGAGYTTIDPETGAGGYMIEGGSNGGWFAGLAAGATLGLILTAFAGAVFAGPLGIGAGIILALIVLTLLLPFIALMSQMYQDGNDDWRACFWGGFGIGLTVSTWSLGSFLAKVVQSIGLAMGIGVPSSAATQCF